MNKAAKIKSNVYLVPYTKINPGKLKKKIQEAKTLKLLENDVSITLK